MPIPPLPWDSAAVLVWLLPGDNADEDDFQVESVKSPPSQNPQGFWTLREAIIHAGTVDCAHGKIAWIKIGSWILNPVEVFEAFELLTSSGS